MKANVFVDDIFAGVLEEVERGKLYVFTYEESYKGLPVSLTMPIENKVYRYNRFPPFFDGLLPEGFMLEAVLRNTKIDRNDLFSQLLAIGRNNIGNVSVRPVCI